MSAPQNDLEVIKHHLRAPASLYKASPGLVSVISAAGNETLAGAGAERGAEDEAGGEALTPALWGHQGVQDCRPASESMI